MAMDKNGAEGPAGTRVRKSKKGASGMEFGVVVGVVAVVAVAATATVGGKVKEIFGGTTNAVQLGMNGQLAPGSTLSLKGGVVAPVPPAINTASLPGGTTGIPYSQQISVTAQNGDGVSFASTGALPTGLSLNPATGMIVGTPSATGAFSFSVTATDTTNALSATQSYSVSVSAGAPAINTGSPLPTATYGSAYSLTLSATTTPSASGVTWSQTGGTLPAWLSFNGTTGVLSGTPNSMSAGSFTLTATDKVNGQSSSLAYALSVAGAAPAITTSTLPNSVWGTAYSQTLAGTTTPGADGINWSFATGTLPAGLGLTTATGAIAGTPAAQGSFPLTVVATDKVTGATATRTMTLTGTASPPVMSTTSLLAAGSGQAYSQTLSASTTPSADGVNWSFASGTLPSGLSLNPATGVISGTTASAGTYPLTILATDKVTGSTATQSLAGGLSVSSTQTISVTISTSSTNVDFRSLLIANGWNQVSPVIGTVTVAAGVWVGSSSTGSPAMTISGSFPTGSTLALVNNGHISGAGGWMSSAAGGDALSVSVPVSVQNNGYLWGGGGAGGNGSDGFWSDVCPGGGGAGYTPGYKAGVSTGGSGVYVASPDGDGGCTGGTGGGPGQASGGPAGRYVVGNAYVVWTAAGTRLGGVS